MLPSFHQACLQSQLTPTQSVTLEILVELLQQERCITVERLATLFPQPILFESRRRSLQRFLDLSQLTPQAIWFPIIKQWIKRHIRCEQRPRIVLDRTQWQNHNLMMVSLVYKKRAIPLYWIWLNQQGQSGLRNQPGCVAKTLR